MDVSSFLEREPLCKNSMSLTNEYHGYYPNLKFNQDKGDTYSRNNYPLCVRSTCCGPAMAIIGPVCGICFFCFQPIEAISEPAGECIAKTYEWAQHSVCCGECPK